MKIYILSLLALVSLLLSGCSVYNNKKSENVVLSSASGSHISSHKTYKECLAASKLHHLQKEAGWKSKHQAYQRLPIKSAKMSNAICN